MRKLWSQVLIKTTTRRLTRKLCVNVKITTMSAHSIHNENAMVGIQY